MRADRQDAAERHDDRLVADASRATATPSTVTGWRRMPPSRAAIVLSSTRSIAAPEVLRIVAVESTAIARVAHEIRR